MASLILVFLCCCALMLLAGCAGGARNQANLPPVDDSQRVSQTNRPSFAAKHPMVVPAGAAALYYLYRHHQATQATGPDGKYYLSQNGRVYYRDAQHRAHWVTPPQGGIQVSANEASQYQQ